jgi:hypothetical protein
MEAGSDRCVSSKTDIVERVGRVTASSPSRSATTASVVRSETVELDDDQGRSQIDRPAARAAHLISA